MICNGPFQKNIGGGAVGPSYFSPWPKFGGQVRPSLSPVWYNSKTDHCLSELFKPQKSFDKQWPVLKQYWERGGWPKLCCPWSKFGGQVWPSLSPVWCSSKTSDCLSELFSAKKVLISNGPFLTRNGGGALEGQKFDPVWIIEFFLGPNWEGPDLILEKSIIFSLAPNIGVKLDCFKSIIFTLAQIRFSLA